jgi:spermidine synthase
VIGVGVLLVMTGIVVWLSIGRGRGSAGAPVAGLAVLLAGTAWTLISPQPCERETAYFCVRVEDDTTHPTGRLLYLDTLLHSYVDVADPAYLEFGYTQIVSDVLAAVTPGDGPVDALHIGGGGFSLPRHIAATRPESRSVVLELDPSIVATARDELGLVTSDALRVRIGDARLGIAEQPSASYDVVVGDAFGGLAVPWHLTSREMVQEVRRVLRPGGIYVVNVIDYPPLRFARSEAATMLDVFGNAGVMGPASTVTGTAGGNVMLLASDEPLPVEALLAANRQRRGTDAVTTDAELDRWIGDATVLTDDDAPVDQLLTRD